MTPTLHLRAVLRVWLAALCLGPILGGPVAAHDGPHGPSVLARVTQTGVTGAQVRIALVITGLGGPLVLVGVGADGARADPFAPVYVDFAQDVAIAVTLDFGAPPPAAFTLLLDFGLVGQGAVAVRTDAAR